MAFSKITTKGMQGDTLEAGDIAANAIGASELADNAVDTAAIAATSITEAKLNADVTDGSAITTAVKPHIQPGLLYPAYKGTLFDTTDPSAASTPEDKSDAAMAITSIDNYTIGTDDPKNGFGYLKTNTTTGSGGSNLTIGDDNDADFQFGTGAFTIEYWVKETDYNWGDHGHMTTSFGAVGWAICLSGEYLYFTAKASVFGSAPTNSNEIIARANRSGHVSDGTWYHVAIVRVSTTDLKIYINGTDRTAEADAGGTYGWGWNNTSNDHNLVLGRAYHSEDEKHTVGGFDDIRITKGLAVYTGNFTAPTSSLTKTWSAGTNIAANSDASKVKLLMTSEGSTTGMHSGAYGTAQSDGRSYYYTDIRGSKPIKDPRIGAYFGGQRHYFRSLQKLEQETGLNSDGSYINVASVDGREWIRSVSGAPVEDTISYDANGTNITTNGTVDWWEVTGYFNAVNVLLHVASGTRTGNVYLDGKKAHSVLDMSATVDSPLAAQNRYFSSHSIKSIDLTAAGSDLSSDTTLGIHTFRYQSAAANNTSIGAIDLIAQDTTDTASKSKIQIPAQNVISYGKKFALSAAAHHYDPFNGFTSGSSVSSYIDTATSLGVERWKHSSTYYRPYNGGRVVKWIATDGTIKTSVTMMPPNAQCGLGTSINAKANASVANNTESPTFSGTLDNSLSEAAKTYHMREFGNGSANQGHGGSHQDATTMDDADEQDWTYVMDDGLTGLNCNGVYVTAASRLSPGSADEYYVYTFIGTGCALEFGSYSNQRETLAQNLPYGTHVLKVLRDGDSSPVISIDGVTVFHQGSTAGYTYEVDFFQPKKPPVPEDACIIADYMLMADFKPVTGLQNHHISKGVRVCSVSRDTFCDETDNGSFGYDSSPGYPSGLILNLSNSADSDTSAKLRMPAFATNYVVRGYHMDTRAKLYIGDTDKDSASTRNNSTDPGSFAYLTSNETLGVQNWGVNSASGQSFHIGHFEFASPIHTSHHYQEFEGPFLKELIGGDRNMEQTNLVVTGDGKTWDEVTRDTSYIGNALVACEYSAENTSNSAIKFDIWRGSITSGSGGIRQMYNKDWAWAYDRVICLVPGQYRVYWKTIVSAGISGSQWGYMRLNGSNVGSWWMQDENYMNASQSRIFNLERGDYIQILSWARSYWSDILQIHRV